MGRGQRQIVWFGVTAHPTAEWIANQLTEACGWEQIPSYLIRDRDGAYGEMSSAGFDPIQQLLQHEESYRSGSDDLRPPEGSVMTLRAFNRT
jgi:hypothetical protein